MATRQEVKKNLTMSKLIDLCGHFQKRGQKLVKENLTLLLSERSHTTQHKSRFFLISLEGNRKGVYISSLYPIDGDEGRFWFEYKQEQYLLLLDGDSASISLSEALRRA